MLLKTSIRRLAEYSAYNITIECLARVCFSYKML
ncbi:hypothetical protein CPL00363_CDS0002 [Klebsiella phage Torridgeon]